MRYREYKPKKNVKKWSLMDFFYPLVLLILLAMLVVPNIGNIIRRMNEKSNLKNIEEIRAAIMLYYANSGGNYPVDLYELKAPRGSYLKGSMSVYTAEHGVISLVQMLDQPDDSLDNGGWVYINSGPDIGTVYIACTHVDSNGKVWSQY